MFSDGFPMVFQWFWRLGNFELAEFKLRLVLNMESKRDGFPMVFGGWEISGSLNLSFGWPSVWRAKVMVFQWFSNGFPMVLVAALFRDR